MDDLILEFELTSHHPSSVYHSAAQLVPTKLLEMGYRPIDRFELVLRRTRAVAEKTARTIVGYDVSVIYLFEVWANRKDLRRLDGAEVTPIRRRP